MNLGTLLSKPGESNYSVYRRFLISNHALTKNLSDINNGLEKNFTELFGEEIKFPGIVEAILMTEGKIFKKEQIITNEKKFYNYSTTSPVKSCPKCSEIGYHSNYYDLKWVTRCPVHNTVLLNKCPYCHKWWPSGNGLFDRKCACCGVGVKIKNILGKYQLDLKVFKLIRNYLKVIKKHHSLNQDILFLSNSKAVKGFWSVNALSAYTIEALYDLNLIKQDEYLKCSQLANLKYKSINCSFIGEKIKEENHLKLINDISFSKIDIDYKNDFNFLFKLSNLKQRVTIRFSQLISNSEKYGLHPIGIKCDGNYHCKTCNIWKEWLDMIFPYSRGTYNYKKAKYNPLYHSTAQDLITHLLVKHNKDATNHECFSVSPNEILKLKKGLKKGMIKVYEIPSKIALLLYELQIWIAANKLLNDHIDVFEHIKQNDCFLEYIPYAFNYQQSFSFNSIYILIDQRNETINLSFPECLLKDSILDSYEMRKLISVYR